MIFRILLVLVVGLGLQGARPSAASTGPDVGLEETAIGRAAATLTGGWQRRPESSVRIDGGALDWLALREDAPGWQPSPPTDEQRGIDEVHWYRRELVVAESGATSLGVFLELYGSAELYVDGRLARTFGRLEPFDGSGEGGAGPTEFGHRFQSLPDLEPGRRELLVRYRAKHRSFAWMGPYHGFRLTLGQRDEVARHATRVARAGSVYQWLFVGAFLTQALLHLLIFVYLPRFPSNAWFSVNAVLSAALAGVHFERSLSDSPAVLSVAGWLWNPLLFVTLIVLLRVIYEVYDHPRGRIFWALCGLALLLATYVVLEPRVDAFGDFWWVHALFLLEALRVNYLAFRTGWRGSGLIGVGLILLAASLLWQFLLVAGVFPQPFDLFPVAYLGMALFLFSVSAYLARKFAQAGETLRDRAEQIEQLSNEKLERELQARLLEADNQRKTDELEAARALQLSLLPRELPEVPGLEIAVSMTTATEVGGDYYDFHVAPDGSLLVAIGDAAGHGASAGNMVAMMKGLFSTFSPGRELPQFFAEANDAIRSMDLPGANTAMALARVTPSGLTYSSAGIPPLLRIRGDGGEVEELLVAGTPLGAMAGFPYQQVQASLQPDDVLLLMSDGLAELPDSNGESLGYERLMSSAGEVASLSASDVIEHLRRMATEWSGGTPFPDDITLVAVKVLGAGPPSPHTSA